jgi:UDP-glucuronate decarboxylase
VQALKGEDITIYGDGSQTRSFCYVDDMVKGIFAMMNAPDDFIGPVNLGNPVEFTIMELARKIIGMVNPKSKIVYHSLPLDDPIRRKPDVSMAREKLDWKPSTSIEEGLKKTIDYFESIIK